MGARTGTQATRMTGMGTPLPANANLPSHLSSWSAPEKMHPDQSKVCPEGLQGEKSNCSEFSSREGGLHPRDPTNPSTMLKIKMTLKSRQRKKMLRPSGLQTTPRQDSRSGRRLKIEGGVPQAGKDGTEDLCQHLQSMPLGATLLNSVQHG